jgi:PAS domain S-box-containing protein
LSNENRNINVEPEESPDVRSIERLVVIPSILRAVSELTGMRFVAVARVTDLRWIACAVLDDMEFGLTPGGELEVATTLCSEIRDHKEPIVIQHACRDTIYCNHPTPKKYGIESYIAVPIVLKNGEFFGTLCAIDSRPADLSSETILESLRLFAALVANELGNETAYAALLESEKKRRESENRIRAVTDAMPGLISYVDREYHYQFVNRAYTEWFGLRAEDILQKPVWEVVGRATFESVKPHIDAALAGKPETFEAELAYRSGGPRFVRATYTPDIFNGEVGGIFVHIIDISEQKRTQIAVMSSEERYRAFIKHSTEGIWRFELEEPIPIDLPTDEKVRLAYKHGFLAECNDAMARQYGFSSAEEIAGARLSDLLVEDDPKNLAFLRAFMESGYNLSEAESHERDADGNDRYFLNNFVGFVENGNLLRAWGTQRDVTRAKLADDATARLAAIVVSSDDAIISKDLRGIITSWNIGATKMFGYKAEEVIGKPISMLMPPERVNEATEILRRIRREENVEHFETVRRRKDGTHITVSLTVSPIRSAEGNVIGASKIVRDISERKRIEEAIHQNQAMLTLAMQSSRMGVWGLDLATNTVSWSEELEEIFGLEKGGFGGAEEHFYELMHEDDREAVWTEIRGAIAEHRRYIIEFRFHHADGSIRWMEGRGEAVYSQKGEPVRLYGVGIDITDRKEAERALRESEQRFSRFMQHLPGLAWIKDLDGRYMYANESAERSFGVSGSELYGKTDEEIFPAETAAHFRAHDRKAVESMTGIQIAESLVEDDGVRHHSIVSKFPITGADGGPALIGGMAIDVTEQKQAEEALRQRMDFDEAVMRNMGEGLYTVDARGIVTSMNPAAEKLFGWRFEEIRGRKMHDVTHHTHRDGTPFPADECAGLQVIRGGESLLDHEDVFVRRDGSFFDVSYSSSPLRENDEIVGLVVVFTDSTERKQAEQRLALQAEIGDLIRMIADPARLLYAVSAAVGRSLDVGRSFFSEIDPDTGRETVHRDYCAEGVQSVAGSHEIARYGPATLTEMREGSTIVNADSKTDPRSAAHYAESYEPAGERSYVAVPLRRSDVLVASLRVVDGEPREWDRQDVSLLETIAERTWTAVEKIRVDAALRESPERFAKAFSSGPLVFTLSSLKDGRLVEVNETFVEVTGYSREEAIGKTSLELGLWSSVEDREDEMAVVRTDGHVRNLEYSFRTRTGEEIIGLLSAEKIEIGGEPFALSVIQDITARKRAEEALAASENLFRAFVTTSSDAVYRMSADWSLMRQLRGREFISDTEEPISDWLERYIHPDDRDKVMNAIREAIRSKSMFELEHRVLRVDGSTGWTQSRAIPILDQDGEITEWFGAASDVTARLQAEDALRQSEVKYRTLFESMDEGYCIIEVIFDDREQPVDYRFVEVNSAFERQSGMSDVTGKRMLEFVSDIESHWLESYGRVAKTGEPIRFANEYQALRRWFDVYAFRPADLEKNRVAVLFNDITSRVRSAERLRESSEFNQDVIDSITAHIAVLDETGEITAVNEAWRQFALDNGVDAAMNGVTVGTNYLDVCRAAEGRFAEGAEAILDGIQTVLNRETEYFTIEYACPSPTAERWFLLTVSPLTRTGGGAVVAHQNITERRLAEEKIRESEARFRTMADNAPVMIWVTDPTGYCTFLSQSWYDYTGQTPETGLGFGWLNALHPTDKLSAEADFRAANERHEAFSAEYRYANAAGEYHWAIDSAQPRFDASGNYLGYIGSVVDIHERKLAEEAMVRAERKAAEEYQKLLGRIVPLAATLGRARDLTSIYRAVREFICASMTCSGFFVSFFESETSLRHAAYAWGEGDEVDIAELPPMPLMPEGGGANSRAVFEKRTVITNRYWDEMKDRPHVVLRHNGRDPLSSLIVPMMIKDKVLGTLEVQAHEDEAFDREHAVALEMAANLAAVAIENVRLIETEAAMREAAEAANRAKDEFLSVLSHELRTPLNAMLGWVRMLKAGVLDAENSERALEVIERNTRLQGSLIEDLLDVSRIISGKMRIETELVDLVSLVETVSETIRPLAEAKNVSYSYESDEETVFLTADPVRMQQVVSNLLQNSIKFTPSEGKIRILIERRGGNAVLSVEDTGVGIEAELIPFIFDRFRQADASARRTFTGLGLGLTIVRNIVELHGGTVDVRSDGKDRGSTFTLTLPLAADFYNSVDPGGSGKGAVGGSLVGKAILLVDDDAENLLPLKIFLENENAEVTPAESAAEAMRLLGERDFHVMITDIGMPEVDGYELIARLRSDTASRNRDLNAIALTAYASVDDRQRALDSGFQAHLAKPVNFEELLAAIEKISGNGENISQ